MKQIRAFYYETRDAGEQNIPRVIFTFRKSTQNKTNKKYY